MNKLSRRFRHLFSKPSRQLSRRRSCRRLRAEQLEGRVLLAANVFHNELVRSDVNNDGYVAPLDALMVINALKLDGSAAEGDTNTTVYLDTNGDNELSPIDVLVPINDLLDGAGEGSPVASYQPIAFSPTFTSAPNFGGFRYVENGANDSIVIVGQGSWLDDGFVAGGQVVISDSGIFVDTGGSPSPDTHIHSNGLYNVMSVTDSTLTVVGNLATTFPANVLTTDNSGNSLAGQEVSDSTAFFFRPIDTVSAGASFLLGMLVEDLRTTTATGDPLPDSSKGVFSGTVDAVFDSNDVSADGTSVTSLRFHNGYTGAPSGDFSTPGLIDEAGASAFGGSLGVPIGAREHLLWRTPFTALASTGNTIFGTDPADASPAHDTLLFGINNGIPTSMIEYSSVTLNVIADVVANDDLANGQPVVTVQENSGPVEIDVLTNDQVFNPPGGTPTINAITQPPAIGGASFNAGSVTYTPPASVNAPTDVTFTYRITNGQGATDTAIVTVRVNPVNDPPINSVPGSQSTNEDTPLSLPPISVSDADGNVNVTVDLSSNLGTVSVSATSGVTITNPNTANVSLGGLVNDVNNALNGITYSPNLNANGPGSVTVSSNDGIATDVDTVDITINPVNDAPVNTAPGPQTLFNTDTLSFGGGAFQVADVDASTLEVILSITDQTTNQPSAGTLSLGSTNGLQVSGNNSNTLTATGSISDLNTALGSLVYDPLDTFLGNDTLTMTTSDLGATGAGGTLTDTDTVTITVTPPQVPFAASDLFTTNEGDGPFTLTPNPLNNDLKDAAATLSVTGTSPTDAPTATSGSLTYDGTDFTYTPPTDANFFGTDTFTYTIAQDAAHTPSSTGDTSSTGTITIEVQPINDGPINTVPDPLSVDEDNSLPLFNGSGFFSVEDIDAGADGVAVVLTVGNGTLNVGSGGGTVTNNGTGTLSIDGTVAEVNNRLGSLTYTPDLNFNGGDALNINTNDGGHTGGNPLSDIDTVDITVQPINDAPTIVVPGQQSFFTDFDNRFSSAPNPFMIADVDAGTSDVQVDLTIGDGTLTLSDSSGVTVTQNPGGNNGIRITGSVANINNALGGVDYRIGQTGDRTLSAVVNDLGNTGGNQLTDTKTVAVEVSDVKPVTIAGSIYVDANGNGQRDPGETGVGNIELTLTGTDLLGNPVSVQTTTNADGTYSFENVIANQPGQPYVITQQQSSFLLGNESTAQVSVDRTGNMAVAGDLGFRQDGFLPEFVQVYDLFALSGGRSSAVLYGMNGDEDFSMLLGDWANGQFSNVRFVPNAAGTEATLTVFDSQLGADRVANISTAAGTLTYRGTGAARVYRVIGKPEDLLRRPDAEGEGDATTSGAAFARGVDSLFANGGL